MFLTTKTYLETDHMTHLHFTLVTKEIQSLIDKSVKDDISKTILTTVFNQLMVEQRIQYIQAEAYERSDKRASQRNAYYEQACTTRIVPINISFPSTRYGKFSPNVFDRYQRNEKALLTSMLEMYVSGVSTRKVSQVVEELCGKQVSKSFISDLTQ